MPHRVLLIDDDKRLYELLATYLAGNDFALSHAEDGPRGLRALESQAVDAVLFDLGEMLGDLDLEVVEMGALVGQLLANARLDFALSVHEMLGAGDLVLRALSRAGLDASLLLVHAGNTLIAGDPTLLALALDNLLENARVHGHGATRLSVQPRSDEAIFVVEDLGRGLPSEDRVEQLFSPFVRGAGATGGRARARAREAHRARAQRRRDRRAPGGGARASASG